MKLQVNSLKVHIAVRPEAKIKVIRTRNSTQIWYFVVEFLNTAGISKLLH